MLNTGKQAGEIYEESNRCLDKEWYCIPSIFSEVKNLSSPMFGEISKRSTHIISLENYLQKEDLASHLLIHFLFVAPPS